MLNKEAICVGDKLMQHLKDLLNSINCKSVAYKSCLDTANLQMNVCFVTNLMQPGFMDGDVALLIHNFRSD